MNTRTKMLSAACSMILLAGIGGALAKWADSAQGSELWTNTGHLDLEFLTSGPALWDISDECNPVPNPADPTNPTFDDCSVATGTPQSLVMGEIPAVPASCTDPDGVADSGWDSPGVDEDACTDLGATWDPGAPAQSVIQEAGKVFYMVPGDKILVAVPLSVDLKGQNIAAQLNLTASNVTSATNCSPLVAVETANCWLVDDAVDPDEDDTDDPQFAAIPYGLWEADDADSLLQKFIDDPGKLVANPNSPFYFTSGISKPIFAVFEVDFRNLGDGIDATSSNDTNGISGTDLMDLTGTSAFDVLGYLQASLVQVRSGAASG